MLKSSGKALMLRFGRRVFVCLRSNRIDPGLRARIRPFVFGGFACWSDRSSDLAPEAATPSAPGSRAGG